MKPVDHSLARLQILCGAFSNAYHARKAIMHRPGPEAEGIEFALDDIQSRIRALIGDEMRAPFQPGLLETMPAGDYHVDEEGQITPIEPSARDKVIASMGLDFVEQTEVGLKRARIEDAADLVRQLTAQCAILGAALAPFARIHERRCEGNERSASVSQSPAACSVQDCQAAWLALNPANAVRDAEPGAGDEGAAP